VHRQAERAFAMKIAGPGSCETPFANISSAARHAIIDRTFQIDPPEFQTEMFSFVL
jgi:hypothetical protein